MKDFNVYYKWYLVIPSIILLLLLTVYPILDALYTSMHQYDAMIAEKPFIWFDNYKDLIFEDERYQNALYVTLLFEVITISIQMVLGLFLAFLFSGDFKFKKIITSIYLVPMMVSPVVVGFTARIAFTNDFGFVPQIINIVLQEEIFIPWLSNGFWAKVVIILADTWQWTPFVFLIIFSGIMSLPIEPIESARVDGANSWQIALYIVLPQLRYILLVTFLIRALDLLKLFDVILLTTRAGPGIQTETISVYIYNLAFKFWSMGNATAASFILLIIITIFTSTLIKFITGYENK
jgi:multiple sugar transport system permease protein